jgi:hypothetical protein
VIQRLGLESIPNWDSVWSSVALLALLALLGWLGLGCTNRAPSLTADELQAQEIWRQHEAAVAEGMDRWHGHDSPFSDALIFFSEVVGIDIAVDIQYPGVITLPGAWEDLDRLREWYSRNKGRLYFDEESRKVQVNYRPGEPWPSTQSLRVARAQEIWSQHETAIAQGLDGQIDYPAVSKAGGFFSRLAGIEFEHSIFQEQGSSSSNTQQDLEQIREWYSKNKDRLYFDEGAQRVHVNSRALLP